MRLCSIGGGEDGCLIIRTSIDNKSRAEDTIRKNEDTKRKFVNPA